MRVLQVVFLLVGIAVLAAGSAVAGRLWLPELQSHATGVTPSAQPTPSPNYKVAIQAIRTRLNASDTAVIGSLGRIKSEVDYVFSPERAAAEKNVSAARDEIRSLLTQSGALGQARTHYLNSLELSLSALAIWPGGTKVEQWIALTSQASAEWRRGDDALP